MKSSENASSERKPPKTTPSTSEPSAACTASLKQDYWPTNSSKHLNKHGYQQSKLGPGLWKHGTRPIQFTLVVNDFGVKYISKEHAQLKKELEEHYKLMCNWTGKQYIGITLDWDYNKHHVHLSILNYVQKALKQFQHKAGKLKYAPYQSAPI